MRFYFEHDAEYKTTCLRCKGKGSVILRKAMRNQQSCVTYFDSYCTNIKCNQYNRKVSWELSDEFLSENPGFVIPLHDHNDIQWWVI